MPFDMQQSPVARSLRGIGGDRGKLTALKSISIYPIAGSLKTYPKETSAGLEVFDSPDCENVEIYRGELRRRRGLSTYLAQLPGGVPPIHFDSFYGNNGIRYIFCSSRAKMYRWYVTASSWGDMSPIGVTLSGTEYNPCSSTSALGKWYFSNGSNYIYWWNEGVYNLQRLQHLTDPAKNPPDKAKFLYYFGNRLNLLHTTEATVVYPRRNRWSSFIDSTNWVDGGAGFKDIDESQYWTTGVVVLDDRALIFRPDGITVQREAPYPYYYVYNQLRGRGCIAPRTIVKTNDGNTVLFLSRNGICGTNGDSTELISKEINWETLITALNFDMKNIYLSSAFLHPDELKYTILFWQDDTDALVVGLTWNFFERTWTRVNLNPPARDIMCLGSHDQLSLDIAWQDANFAWLNAEFPWVDSVPEASKKKIVLAGEDRNFYLWEGQTGTDAGTAFVSYWKSKPFYLPGVDPNSLDMNELYKIGIEGSGTIRLRCGYGKFGSNITWGSWNENLGLTANGGYIEVDLGRLVGRYHQVEIQNYQNNDFTINRITPKYMLRGDRA